MQGTHPAVVIQKLTIIKVNKKKVTVIWKQESRNISSHTIPASFMSLNAQSQWKAEKV